jgi:hypothetical protein
MPATAPRPAAGAPAANDPRARPLPQFEGTGGTNTEDILEDEDDDELAKTKVVNPMSSSPHNAAPVPAHGAPPPKSTVLGLGPPPALLPPTAQPLPSFAGAAPPPSGVMHDYASEDEDIVTTIMDSPLEEESHTVSTVHEPAKSQRPAPTPDDAIVVAPTLLMPSEPSRIDQPMPVQMPYGTVPPGSQMQYPPQPYPMSATGSPPEQQRSSVLIAVIAAATTLIALTLTALVVLKITDSPKESSRGDRTTSTATTAASPGPTPAPTPAPTPVVVGGTPSGPEVVDPSSLPKEKTEGAETKPEPKPEPKAPIAVAPGTSKPVPKPVPGPTPPTPPSTKGEVGYLTVMCVPGCDSVTAGGRNLGPSPVVRAALPPGNHGVSLRAAGKKSKSLGVTIVSGQTTARRVNMD